MKKVSLREPQAAPLRELQLADIVTSLNGRDAGKIFCVIGTQEEYSLIADGKGRRYERPKKKKNKHLRFEDKAGGIIAVKLMTGEKVTNNELRRMLAIYRESREHADKEPETEGGVLKCQKTI